MEWGREEREEGDQKNCNLNGSLSLFSGRVIVWINKDSSICRSNGWVVCVIISKLECLTKRSWVSQCSRMLEEDWWVKDKFVWIDIPLWFSDSGNELVHSAANIDLFTEVTSIFIDNGGTQGNRNSFMIENGAYFKIRRKNNFNF